MERLGFIGMGNMAQALCAGFVNSGKIAAESVYAYAPHYDKLVKNSEKYGFTPCKTLAELVDAVDTVIMACKPYQINDVLVEIGERLHGKALVSVAAGWDFKKYSEYFDSSVRVQFVMPNTPAMVYEGVMLFEAQNSLEEEERIQIKELFAAVGIVEELPSNLMGIGGAVTGCGPAFVDLFIEGYADAAVKYGVPRQTGVQTHITDDTWFSKTSARDRGASRRVEGQCTSPLQEQPSAVLHPLRSQVSGVHALSL